MKKLLIASFAFLTIGVLSGCATTGTQNSEVVVVAQPRIVYVNPHNAWIHHHHWHWTWTHRHGWGWHHPRYHHIQPIPPRHNQEQRKTIPAPVGPDRVDQIK